MSQSIILIGFYTLCRREITRFTRLWIQTLLPPVITTCLYLLIFGRLMGERIGDMDGIPYISYIFPGLVMMTVLINAYANVVASFFGAKFQKNIEEMLVAPLPSIVILAGFIAGGITRGMIVGTLVIVAASFFIPIHIYSFWEIISVGFVTATLFSLVGFINGVYAKKFDDINIVPTFVLNPLIYLGGVFYSVALLPDFWRTLSLANPLLYIINAFRYGFLGVSDIPVMSSILVITMITLAVFLFAWYLLERGIGIKA